MSYFEGQTPAWVQQHTRQQSWDQSQPSSVSTPQQDDGMAFSAQFEEIDRASDNLSRTGKGFGPGFSRRDMPGMPGRFSRQYGDFDRSMHNTRHNSPGEYDGMRSHSAHSSTSVQGYYASQRFGPRLSEADQMMQAKRRAAAQRERDLRNYHTEQQYARNLATAKSERSMSPGASAMSEEDRRELIARQHRALYGDGSNLYTPDGVPSRPLSQDARVLAATSSGHGSSPLAFDSFSPPATASLDATATGPASGATQQRSPDGTNTSKSPNPNAFTMFEKQQSGHASSNTQNEDSGSHSAPGVSSANNVAPIGTRPPQTSNASKRTTPPTPVPHNFGFGSDNNAERAASAASNPGNTMPEKPVGLGWSSNAGAGAWSSNKHPLGVQASVWG